MNSKPKTIPFDIGTIHFIGIGGIGMSGIAEILHNLGYKVQGSDSSNNTNVTRLEQMGINVKIPQHSNNILNASVIVKSSAIKDTNPEIIAAKEHDIPIIKRAEMLAELMRLKNSIAVAGTHGKTTTTSMITSMLETAKLSPTVINGGIINTYGTNAKLGKGEWLIAEADESDGTFLKLPATVGIITNIDPEHMEHYGNFKTLKNAFKTFIENLPFYGFGVLCKDHPEVSALASQITDRKVITYGIDSEADIKANNIRTNTTGNIFDVSISSKVNGGARTITNISLPMPGKHNISNSLAAIAVAAELNIDDKIIANGFTDFQGVKRRFTKTGEVNNITIIDDYGHHPKEINVTLQTAKQITTNKQNNVIAVVQPHRYSRLKDLFNDFCQCFNHADKVLVTNIYEAGEQPIEGITRDSLIEGIKQHGHPSVHPISSQEDLTTTIHKIANPGDIVVCLGAGDITQWANALPEKLQNLQSTNNN